MMTDSSDERDPAPGERTAPARNLHAARDELRVAVAAIPDGELRRLEQDIVEEVDHRLRARAASAWRLAR